MAPGIKPDTLGYSDPVPLCTEPGARRSLFDADCPLVMPVDIGTSILLSAPGLLLALFAFRRHARARLSIGTALAVVLIATFNLAHFSQGWVQWGYRFSLDFVPFLLPMVALGAARDDGRLRVLAAVAHRGRGGDQPVGRHLGPDPRLVASPPRRRPGRRHPRARSGCQDPRRAPSDRARR